MDVGKLLKEKPLFVNQQSAKDSVPEHSVIEAALCIESTFHTPVQL